jgi:hypothetical protein
MARDFDDASEQYLETDSPRLTAEPFTLACWAVNDDTALTHALVWFGRSDVGNDRHYVGVSISGAVVAVTVDGATTGTATAGSPGNGVLFHAAGVWASDSSRTAYLNGAPGTEDTTATAVSGENRISIGRSGDSTPAIYHDGLIAHAAAWNAALTTAEIAQLAKRVPPWLIRPQALVHYWPLWGRHTTEPDLVGATGLTVTGATFAADPVGLLIPLPRRLITTAAAVAGGRIMGSLAGAGGLAGPGGIAGRGGGLAG